MYLTSIQQRLFLAFGCLILVVSLFFTRLTYVAVAITEEVMAARLLEKVLTDMQGQEKMHQGAPSIVMLLPEESYASQQLSTTQLDRSLFRLNNAPSVFLKKAEVGGQKYWLVLDATALLPFSGSNTLFGVFLLSITLGAAVLAVLSTWFIANLLAKPIKSLTKAVEQQLPSEPCELAANSRHDELGALAKEFQYTFQALQHAWQRERDFTRDVSHELRTPITLIRNTLTLAESRALTPRDNDTLHQATLSLQQTVEVLLALARKENLSFSPMPVLPLIEKAILALHLSQPEREFNVDVGLNSEICFHGNPYLASLLFQNLINNGFYHGGKGRMQVSLEQSALVFCNALRTSEQLDNQAHEYQGLGHGQYLVSRIASVMNWQVTIKQTDALYRVEVRDNRSNLPVL